MQHVQFGKRNGLKIPRVNIGAMRLPADTDDAARLLRHAIDSGMRYIDTSRGYGDSEIKIGRALKNGYRDKVILSTKWSPWIMKVEPDDAPTADCEYKRILESLKRLDVEYLDYYQLWNIQNRDEFATMTGKGGMLDGIRRAQKEGLVKRAGFTTHDSVENIMEYIKIVDWADIILVTYNMFDRTYEPVLKAAHDAGIGTIVMNPVAGGKLTGDSDILLRLAKETGAISVADLALRWVLSNPNVDTAISGITKPSDVDASIESANAGPFTPEQMQTINAFVDCVKPKNVKFCTHCKYCLPCPQEINIPAIMGAIYDAKFLGLKQHAIRRYAEIKGKKAEACVECGDCEEKCTQKLKIIDELKAARRMFER